MFKWITVSALIAVFSFWHIHGSATNLESHLIHQELFFIPIILASFWFRLPGGIAIAVFVSLIYLSSMLPHMESHNINVVVYMQMTLYIFIASLIGWLTERLHKQQLQIIEEERLRSLTKLAFALSSEIQNIVHSFKIKYEGKKEIDKKEDESDFREEINKLEKLTNAFQQFSVESNEDLLSQDLNDIVKTIHKKLKHRLKENQQAIKVELDSAGCPSMVISEAIIQLLESLVVNAIEASPENSIIYIRSTRRGSFCQVEVIDEGSGVSKENIPKLFSPFFTTKKNGHGLSLAAGKKIMKECEGDIQYEPGETAGSIFKLIIPRENRDKNIDKVVTEQMNK